MGRARPPPDATDLKRCTGEALALAQSGHDEQAKDKLNAAVDGFLDLFEIEAVHLYHLDEQGDPGPYTGRSKGHRFIRAPLLGPKLKGRPTAPPTARRLRMLQDRATDLGNAIDRAKSRGVMGQDVGERARSAIHAATSILADGKLAASCHDLARGLKQEAREVEARAMQPDALAHLGPENVREIAEAAGREAEPEEKTHRQQVAKSISEWCKEALSNGAGLAHRWTQVPVEWRPEEVECRRGVEAGSTTNPDALVQHELGKWAELWRPPGGSQRKPRWGPTRHLPRPLVKDVRAAAKKFKKKTKLGVDGIHPRISRSSRTGSSIVSSTSCSSAKRSATYPSASPS